MKFRYWPVILVVVISTMIMFQFYGKYILDPSETVLSSGGDGLKNYFTYLYHIEHDAGFMHFEGMNHPFGEYVMFTDNQPALSNPMKLIGNNSLTVHHWLIYLSYVLSAVFLYLLFEYEKIKPLLAIPFAVLITFLSPQVLLMQAHFSMAYVCFIPIQLYLLRRYTAKEQNKWMIWLMVFNLIWFFFHPYLGTMNAVFLAFFFGIKALRRLITKRWDWKLIGKWVSIFAAPLILFLLINAIFDQHPNRSNYPIGFFEFSAEPYMYFLPNTGPLKEVLYDSFEVYTEKSHRVGLLYLGILTSFILLIGMGLLLYKRFIKKNIKQPLSGFQTTLFGAGLLILFLSLCWPFKLGLEGLADYLGPFRQFRTLERFGWVAYFVMLVSVVFLLNRWMVRFDSRKLYKYISTAIVLGIIAVYVIEVNAMHLNHRRIMEESEAPNPFLEENIPTYLKPTIQNIDPNDYGCILAFPYFHFASEVIDVVFDPLSSYNAYLLSYHMGLPMINSNMSRTSFDETKMAINLLGPVFTKKSISDYFSNKKDILIVHSKHDLRPEEKEILEKSMLLEENDKVAVYRIAFDQLFEYKAPDISKLQTLPVEQGDCRMRDSSALVLYNSFEDLPNKRFEGPRGAVVGSGRCA